MRTTFALTALAVAACGQAALLHDNGPWITGSGNGFNGANTSQIAAGGSLLGSNINTATPFFVADDFTIGAGNFWTLNSISFYTYQTQAADNTTSTISSARVGIFDAAPTNTTQDLVSGSLASNGNILSNAWSGVYRVSPTTLTNNQRAVMKVTVDLGGVVLGAGTYWIAWGAAGSVASGPWGVPLSPVKAGSNAIQWNGTTSAWAAVVDAGNGSAMDMAFEIEGEPVPEPATMLALGGALAAFARRRRK